jgi:hypothetical protein
VNAAPVVQEPSPRDSVATLRLFAQRVAEIDRDSTQLQQTQRPVSLGAGVSGLLTAWRAGPVWRKARLEVADAHFRSEDTYWLSNGVLLGAILVTQRPGGRTAVDSVWFRNRALYRWTDAAGRHLNRDAQSTQTQVEQLLARYDLVMRELAVDDATRPTAR